MGKFIFFSQNIQKNHKKIDRMLSEGILRNNFEESYANNFPTFLDEKNHLGHNMYVSHDHQNFRDSIMLAQ